MNPPMDPNARSDDDTQVYQVSTANREFGFRLLAQLNQATPDQNIFVSSFSIAQVLTLLLNGAGGRTQAEMTETLGLRSMRSDQINPAHQMLREALEHPDPTVQISIANALWVDRHWNFNSTFQEQCLTYYRAQTGQLDFGDPVSAADMINRWVEVQTRRKIETLVSPEEIAGGNFAVTNAIYFHGDWTEPFQKKDTRNLPFTLASGLRKSIPMMCQTTTYGYLETPEFQAVILPYGSGRICLDLFLPKVGHDLIGFLSGLNEANWTHWISAIKTTKISLTLPRFHADYSASLSMSLKALGIVSAFTTDADFRPMGITGGFISQVIHKSVLDVDERGTEAAAVTGALLVGRALSRPFPIVRVDHPFFVAIRDSVTGTILFSGVIRDPK